MHNTKLISREKKKADNLARSLLRLYFFTGKKGTIYHVNCRNKILYSMDILNTHGVLKM